jgi:HEAT repeat protein
MRSRNSPAIEARPQVRANRHSGFWLTVHHQTPAWKGEWWAYHPFRLNPPAKTVEWSGTALVLSAFRTALSAAETNVQLAAIAGVQLARDLPAISRLRALTLENVPTAIRASAIRALGELSDGDTAAVITEILRNENAEPEIREAALEAAGQLASAELPLLTEALLNIAASDTAAERDRIGAINAIGRAKLTNSVAELVKAARSSSATLRDAAVRALAGLGHNAAVAPLSDLARTALPATRREAIAALGGFTSGFVVAALARSGTRRRNTRRRTRGAHRLPKVEAVPAYLDALGSSDVLLREKARRAVREIRDKALPVIEARSETLTPTCARTAPRL